MTNVTQLPDLSAVLDLDAYERDAADVKSPFVVTLGGRNITFKDPEDIEWRDLAAVQQPGDLIRISLSGDDLDHIRKQELPTWKFKKLMDSYYAYYDLEDKINDARRQAQLGGL